MSVSDAITIEGPARDTVKCTRSSSVRSVGAPSNVSTTRNTPSRPMPITRNVTYKTRQGQTRQDKTRPDQTRQDQTRHTQPKVTNRRMIIIIITSKTGQTERRARAVVVMDGDFDNTANQRTTLVYLYTIYLYLVLPYLYTLYLDIVRWRKLAHSTVGRRRGETKG
jgi:hypothetical protein